MTEEDISLANAIVDLLENFNKVFFNNYWDNNYNPFSSYSFFKDWRNSEDEKREVLENGENKQCYQYVKNKFDDIKKEFNKIENSNCDSLRNSINLLNFQTELKIMQS